MRRGIGIVFAATCMIASSQVNAYYIGPPIEQPYYDYPDTQMGRMQRQLDRLQDQELLDKWESQGYHCYYQVCSKSDDN